jgi:hypothetical protein
LHINHLLAVANENAQTNVQKAGKLPKALIIRPLSLNMALEVMNGQMTQKCLDLRPSHLARMALLMKKIKHFIQAI